MCGVGPRAPQLPQLTKCLCCELQGSMQDMTSLHRTAPQQAASRMRMLGLPGGLQPRVLAGSRLPDLT